MSGRWQWWWPWKKDRTVRPSSLGFLEIRPASPADLPEIARIQTASPEAARWKPESYLGYDCLVATLGGHVTGFLVARRTAPGEMEILNLAVEPEARRSGVATALMREALAHHRGEVFLEVRQSNEGARALYRSLGFQDAGIRQRYYVDPPEDGIVMRLQSC
jgi:[ribosomal protein S18]-alanine N-acetyltransferase